MDQRLGHRAPIVLTARAVLLVLCLGLTAYDPLRHDYIGSALGLVLVAALASAPWPVRVAPWIPITESILAAAVISGTSPLNANLLPYLLVPALAAGLTRGFRGAIVAPLMAALVLALGGLGSWRGGDLSSALAPVTQWIVGALALGLVAAWARRLDQKPDNPDVAAYESAYRLLNQLRSISRQLSAGLDQVTLAESMLDDLLLALPAERGAVFVATAGARFTPLAARSVRPEVWAPRTTDASPWARTWRSGTAQSAAGGLGGNRRDGVAGAVLPVRVGQRTVALVGVERDGEDFASHDLEVATTWATDYALRLDTALLFAEVRSIATTEERRRLAREIHDGVAQELASLGYAIDDLAAQAGQGKVRVGLQELRSEITRVITELRLSIFDLRSEVSAGSSLGTALSDYIRSLGPTAGLDIHLTVRESTQRLRIETEAELLRIAQEALTNSRRHAQAQNIWLSCTVEPPRGELIIEDDGSGLGQARADSFGLEIMRERASRIGATLDIDERREGGTIVRVSLGEVVAAVPDEPAHST